jgi:DNA polymerase-3 subunit alpha
MDKYDAEKKGLLKLDFLGLTNMTAIDNMRKEMGWSLDELYNLNVHDPELLTGFAANDVIGIFQFEGPACRYVNGALQPETFKHVYDVTALARPGPLHNGAANEYIDIKWGRKPIEKIHPAMSNICDATYGQVVYQEQILRILGEIGGFDHTHRAEVRRIISRKIGEQEFNRRWGRFRDGATRLHDMDPEVARKIWMTCITAGAYAFNAAHAVSYAMIASHAMWFKRYEPELFYKHMLRVSADDRQRTLLRDTQRKGRKMTIKPPDPQNSEVTWTSKEGELIAGFSQVPGIGDVTGQKIVDYRHKFGLEDWEDLLAVSGIGPKTMLTIRDFAEKGDDPFGALWLDRAIAHTKEEIANFKLPVPTPTHVAEDFPYERGEIDIECVWLGTLFSRNERDLFEFNQAKGAELDMSDPKHPLLNGKLIKDPHLDKWVVMVGHDESDQIGLRVDRWRYPRLRDQVWKIRPGKDLVLVRGVKPGWMPTRQITINEIWIIDPEI